jgi:hypothetical protein
MLEEIPKQQLRAIIEDKNSTPEEREGARQVLEGAQTSEDAELEALINYKYDRYSDQPRPAAKPAVRQLYEDIVIIPLLGGRKGYDLEAAVDRVCGLYTRTCSDAIRAKARLFLQIIAILASGEMQRRAIESLGAEHAGAAEQAVESSDTWFGLLKRHSHKKPDSITATMEGNIG